MPFYILGWNISKQFSCHECGKSYSNKKALQNHTNSHKGLTFCEICSKNFSTVSNFRAHMNSHHFEIMWTISFIYYSCAFQIVKIKKVWHGIQNGQINSFLVTFALKSFQIRSLFRITEISTKEEPNAQYVRKSFPQHQIWAYTWEILMELLATNL